MTDEVFQVLCTCFKSKFRALYKVYICKRFWRHRFFNIVNLLTLWKYFKAERAHFYATVSTNNCLPEIFSQKQLNSRLSRYSKCCWSIFCANWFWWFFNFAYQIQYWHALCRIHVYWKPCLKIPQINPYAYTTKYNRSSINIKGKDTIVSPVQWPQWMYNISKRLGISLYILDAYKMLFYDRLRMLMLFSVDICTSQWWITIHPPKLLMTKI